MILIRHTSHEERFAKDRIEVGSSAKCDFRVPGVAPSHCEVRSEDGWLLVVDKGSAKGTFVNGARIGTSPCVIASGDRVRLGETGPELELDSEGAMRATTLRERWAPTLRDQTDPELTCRSDERELSLMAATTLASLGGGAATPAPGAPPSAAPPSGEGYELVAELGRGGMGVVYRARQRGLAREVAIKKILPECDSADTRARFVAEAVTTGFLDHPNIVPVHELKADRGEVLLSMKLVNGVSWKDLLHPRKPEHSPLAEKYDRDAHLGVLLAAANAVAFAHSKEVVHRDLKPENIMVGAFGEVLVMDWGLAVSCGDPAEARAPHRSTIAGPAGTPAYMAPEMVQEEAGQIGPATDVYLLGAILHEILVGRPPHSGRTVFAVLLAAARAEPPLFPASVPIELAVICARALAKKPEERFGSVVELQEAIRAHLRHRESTRVSRAAAATLEEAVATRGSKGPRATLLSATPFLAKDRRYVLYDQFAEAIAGFKQAALLWTENPDCPDGERRARLAYADTALQHGDAGLAEGLVAALPSTEPSRAKLLERLARARRGAWFSTSKGCAMGFGLAVFAFVLVYWSIELGLEHDREKTDRLSTEARLYDATTTANRVQTELEFLKARYAKLQDDATDSTLRAGALRVGKNKTEKALEVLVAGRFELTPKYPSSRSPGACRLEVDGKPCHIEDGVATVSLTAGEHRLEIFREGSGDPPSDIAIRRVP